MIKKVKKGIDISYFQGDIDFNLVKNSGIEFVIIRDGYKYTTDTKFFEYVQKAREAGITILGVYHFSYALNIEEARVEARFCIENMKKAGLGPDVKVFYDFEYDTVNKAAKKGITLTRTECIAYTTAFCQEVIRNGYQPGVYMNIDYHKNWYDGCIYDVYPVWLADYSGEPDFDCLVRQYSSKGQVPGINGNVDLNYLYEEKLTTPFNPPTSPEKDITTIANEVISGVWGDGNERKSRLEAAGYNYDAVQNEVNNILNSSGSAPQPIKKVETTHYAKHVDSNLAGTYVTTADLYCRENAGVNSNALCLIPAGTKVQNYGYYNISLGVKWLLIQFVLDNVQYTGFSSIQYLLKS